MHKIELKARQLPDLFCHYCAKEFERCRYSSLAAAQQA
jgi:hypothetical protein